MHLQIVLNNFYSEKNFFSANKFMNDISSSSEVPTL